MKLNFKIKNLGKLKEGTVKIRPLTVLAGKNATGKSFVTKSLYSIFSVLNKNVLHAETTKNIDRICHLLSIPAEQSLSAIEKPSKESALLQSQLQKIHDSLNDVRHLGIEEYFFRTYCSLAEIDECSLAFNRYLKDNQNNKKLHAHLNGELKECFKILQDNFKNCKDRYFELLGANFADEIKENFQIANLYELIAFDCQKCEILGDGIYVDFDRKNKIDFYLERGFINEITKLSRVVFFESPTYWRIREALNQAKRIEYENDLTGVAKYFYDLDKTLKTKSKNEPIEEILKLAENIKQTIGGEFIFEGGQLYFVDNNGKTIDKNLVSFGMTNLGMVQALLKNNVISKGSFVFFDEPETNLHPQWQVLLANVIITLAKNNVNIVVATHSLDMIKALEVKTKGEKPDFIAINHFKNNKIVNAKIKTVLDDLSSEFYDLYMDNL